MCAPSTAAPFWIPAASSPPARPGNSSCSPNLWRGGDISRTWNGSGTQAAPRTRISNRVAGALRLPRRDPFAKARCPRPLYPADPRPPGPRRMHHGTDRQLSRLVRVHRPAAAQRDRTGLPRMALAHQGPLRTAFAGCTAIFIPGTSCSGRARTSRSSTARAENGESLRTTRPAMTINYLFFSLQRSGRLEGPFEKMFLSVLGQLPRKDRRPGNARGRCPLLCLARPGDREPGLVSAPARGRAQDHLQFHSRTCSRPIGSIPADVNRYLA